MRDIRQGAVRRWYDLELVRESFALVLDADAFRWITERLQGRGPASVLGGSGGPFAPPRIGQAWGIGGCIRSFRRTDDRVTCEFFGESYRPDRAGIASALAGAQSLSYLMALLATYEGRGEGERDQLVTLDQIGSTQDGLDQGNIAASITPTLARWIAQRGSNQPIKGVRAAMLDGVRGTRQFVPTTVNAWCTDARRLSLEIGDISLDSTVRGDYVDGGYSIVSKNVRHPADHYGLLCGLARLCELARRDGI